MNMDKDHIQAMAKQDNRDYRKELKALQSGVTDVVRTIDERVKMNEHKIELLLADNDLAKLIKSILVDKLPEGLV